MRWNQEPGAERVASLIKQASDRDVVVTMSLINLGEVTYMYVDAFAAALAIELEATLLTGDLEFQALSSQVAIEWLANAS